MKGSLAHPFLGHSTHTQKKILKTVLSILFEKVLQLPAHLSRGAKLRDRQALSILIYHRKPKQNAGRHRNGLKR